MREKETTHKYVCTMYRRGNNIHKREEDKKKGLREREEGKPQWSFDILLPKWIWTWAISVCLDVCITSIFSKRLKNGSFACAHEAASFTYKLSTCFYLCEHCSLFLVVLVSYRYVARAHTTTQTSSLHCRLEKREREEEPKKVFTSACGRGRSLQYTRRPFWISMRFGFDNNSFSL